MLIGRSDADGLDPLLREVHGSRDDRLRLLPEAAEEVLEHRVLAGRDRLVRRERPRRARARRAPRGRGRRASRLSPRASPARRGASGSSHSRTYCSASARGVLALHHRALACGLGGGIGELEQVPVELGVVQLRQQLVHVAGIHPLAGGARTPRPRQTVSPLPASPRARPYPRPRPVPRRSRPRGRGSPARRRMSPPIRTRSRRRSSLSHSCSFRPLARGYRRSPRR